MGIFERYLSLWVAISIAVGVALGIVYPPLFEAIARLEVGCRRFHLGDDLSNDGAGGLFYH